MKEILTSFFKTSEERIHNPFIGTFILSFIALNWKSFLILLFSSKTIEDKINFISTNYNDFWLLLIYPFSISVFYILILPYIMWLFDYCTFKAVEGRNSSLYRNKLSDIKGKKNIAEEEIELENIKSDYKEKADLNRKIKELEFITEEKIRELGDLLVNLDGANNKIETLSDEIDRKEIRIKEVLEQNKNLSILKDNYYTSYSKTPNEVIRNFVQIMPIVNTYFSPELSGETKRQIENYLSLGLIELVTYENSQRFRLTDKGLYFLSRAI